MEVKELTTHLKPREILLSQGATCLSDIQLISAILGSGIKGKKVTVLSAEVLTIIDKHGLKLQPEHLLAIKGLGQAKAVKLCAALEFSRRIYCPAQGKIKTPSDALKFVQHFSDRQQEMFLCLSLNGAHEVMFTRVVSMGLLNRTVVHPREVFSDPIKDRAAAIVVAHNHPSGNVEPSVEDHDVTFRLQQAGEILGIQLLDHIIFSEKGYYSFMEEGEFSDE